VLQGKGERVILDEVDEIGDGPIDCGLVLLDVADPCRQGCELGYVLEQAVSRQLAGEHPLQPIARRMGHAEVGSDAGSLLPVHILTERRMEDDPGNEIGGCRTLEGAVLRPRKGRSTVGIDCPTPLCHRGGDPPRGLR